jgi:hypothetical protein
MDASLRTPLLDMFRRGEAAPDVRMMAAQGTLSTRLLDRFGLLMMLAGDADREIRSAAEATLDGTPPDLIARFIARTDTPEELRAFFVGRGVAPSEAPLSDAEAGIELPDADDKADGQTEDEKQSIVTQLSAMTVPEKVKAAMKGSREIRAILVRDPNKMVSMAVMSSPKMTDAEVESIAKMGSVSEDVLRVIGQNRAWMKNYNVMLSLVKNAKTPLAMTLTLLQRLNDRDLRAISISRNVPEPLRIAARKKVVTEEK